MSKRKIEKYKLHVTDYLDKAFTDKALPTNAIIEKGRCGIGGTFLELTNKNRKSIIVVPTTGIIEDKIDALDEKGNFRYPDLYAIYGRMKPEDIAHYISEVQPQKIIITPDSLLKFVTAMKSVKGLWEKVKKEYFLLFDEFHSIITEAFREKMIPAFEHLFEFENKSVISATPYQFTDPRMKELDLYQISFFESLGEVNIINATSVKACLNSILTGNIKMQGNVHIFYNSVTEVGEAINFAELEDCNIYCAAKSENLNKLGKAAKFHKPKPITGKYKKFNFYTSKYYEGWDLEDEYCTIILVTDVYKPHTRVGIKNKGVQSIGRIRTKPDKPETYPTAIYHITNHNNIYNMKSIEHFTKNYFFHAVEEIESFNRYIDKCKIESIEPLKEKIEFVEKFAIIDTETGKATICNNKVDQIINESYSNEVYNHINFIKDTWEKANYITKMHEYKEVITPKEKQKKTKLTVKEIIKSFHSLEPNEGFIFNTEEMEILLTSLKSKYPILYEAYKKLTLEEIELTNYNNKEIEKLLILKNNKDAEIRILKLLPIYFTVGNRYTKEYIKTTLQKIYNEAGSQKKATAEHLKKMQWYETKPCKIKNKDGKDENGFEIIRMTFRLTVSARKD